MRVPLELACLLLLLAACGARTGLSEMSEIEERAADRDAGVDAGELAPNGRPEVCRARPPDSLTLEVRGERWPSVFIVAGVTEACGAVQVVLSSDVEPLAGSGLARPIFPYLALTVRTFPGAAPGSYPLTGAWIDRFDRIELEGSFELTDLGFPGDDPRGLPRGEDEWCACDPGYVESMDPGATCDGRPETSSLAGQVRIDHPEVSIDASIDARLCHALHAICL